MLFPTLFSIFCTCFTSLSSLDSSVFPHVQSDGSLEMTEREMSAHMRRLLLLMERLDNKIGPMMEQDGAKFNQRSTEKPLRSRDKSFISSTNDRSSLCFFSYFLFFRWGYLSRAGLWDKSHLTRQIEKLVVFFFRFL